MVYKIMCQGSKNGCLVDGMCATAADVKYYSGDQLWIYLYHKSLIKGTASRINPGTLYTCIDIG